MRVRENSEHSEILNETQWLRKKIASLASLDRNDSILKIPQKSRKSKKTKVMTKSLRFPALFLLIAAISSVISGQNIDRIEPPSWFTGMKETALQVMVYGKEIGSFNVTADYPGVRITTLVKTENPNYLFVNLDISKQAVPGDIRLTFTRGKLKLTHNYPLLAHPTESARGFDASDVIYLLMPDRFANGDPANDNVIRYA